MRYQDKTYLNIVAGAWDIAFLLAFKEIDSIVCDALNSSHRSSWWTGTCDRNEGPSREDFANSIPGNGHNTLIGGKVDFQVSGFDRRYCRLLPRRADSDFFTLFKNPVFRERKLGSGEGGM